MSPANTYGKRRRIVSSYETGETSSAPPRRRMSQRLRSITSQTTESSGSMRRALPSYSDCGDCTYICEHCNALFWFNERVLHAAHVRHPRYNQCCKSGAVSLTFPLQPPPVIKQLFRDPQFLENIRAYNNMFSMTSFGANVDDTINDGRGPYIFKISGQVSHWIRSLCPPPNEKPRFLQMYIYDTENEISNRLRFFNNSDQHNLSHTVVATLSQTLNAHNKYVRLFKNASEICSTEEGSCYSIRLYNNVPDRRYGAPSPDTLGGIVCGDDFNASGYDIIIHSKGGIPQRVSKLHPSYMPLQYPLLFPLGEEGWSPNLKLRTADKDKRMTANMYYSYQILDRAGVYSLLLNGGRLFQQYLVDAYTCIEQNRLDYYNANQDLFRSEYIAGLYDALSRGDTECRDIGKRIFLPSSFTGGPRYMYKHYQDALAICRVHGNPQYFITFTCNVKWPEIIRYMHRIGCLSSQNRPDIIARVFQMKVKEFIKFIKEDQTFGEVAAYLYTIEFQKRGLPHCHTLVWVTETNKIRDASDVDSYITAEFLDPNSEPVLYKTITECMIHGPCGLLNPNAPCMHEGKCSKHFPKSFQAATQFDKDGYVHYKRRAENFHVSRNGPHIDCGYVVPYNKRLCSRFNAHINVEYCGWNMMIKYLFKYISKGADRIRFAVRRSESYSPSTSSDAPPIIDEIKNFLDGRFICPHEASWRILDFSLHERSPSVQVLAVHLENMQNVTFRERSRLQSVINNLSFGKTTLTEWFSNNNKESESDGLDLTYNDYPSRYRWELSAKVWLRRAQARPTAIGRLVYIHPTAGEIFYLRLLLCYQKGCKSYSDVRTVSGVTYTTFRGACEALGLLGDDREWVAAFTEASTWATSSELRSLFLPSASIL
ncbi:putative helitron helicase-like domain-containing protein [Helianthus annuus]|nr:putative helitron helicase-like domain-containing protein [Helianthus annuus]